MTVVTVPGIAPSRKFRRASIVLMLLAFLGLLSWAAIQEMKVECRPVFLADGSALLADGSGLLAEGEQCQLVLAGKMRVPLPAWTQVIRKALL